MNTLEKTGVIKPIAAIRMPVRITKAKAAAVPFSRFLAKSQTLRGLPEGTKFSPFSKQSVIPVKDLSNSSRVTSTVPRAGSLMTARSFDCSPNE